MGRLDVRSSSPQNNNNVSAVLALEDLVVENERIKREARDEIARLKNEQSEARDEIARLKNEQSEARDEIARLKKQIGAP